MDAIEMLLLVAVVYGAFATIIASILETYYKKRKEKKMKEGRYLDTNMNVKSIPFSEFVKFAKFVKQPSEWRSAVQF